MKLEDQVCSLDLAKKLKELGVKQESAWYWKHNTESPTGPIDSWMLVHYQTQPYVVDSVYHVSAFTVAELGGMLPPFVKDKDGEYVNFQVVQSDQYKWGISYRSGPFDIAFSEWAVTESDARAKMLIDLIENKLIEV